MLRCFIFLFQPFYLSQTAVSGLLRLEMMENKKESGEILLDCELALNPLNRCFYGFIVSPLLAETTREGHFNNSLQLSTDPAQPLL
jgi:hypothetical protein